MPRAPYYGLLPYLAREADRLPAFQLAPEFGRVPAVRGAGPRPPGRPVRPSELLTGQPRDQPARSSGPVPDGT